MGQELEQLVTAYRSAERRLRDSLFGDGLYTSGAVRGAEARDSVGKELRHLRASFDSAVRLLETVEQERALDAELKQGARRAARRTKKP